MSNGLKKTQLFSYHIKHGKMVDFAGFNLPLYYSSIVDEHNSVREKVGIFDISHMGRIKVVGKDATSFLDHLVPSDIANLKEGKAKYTVLCNESGGIVDDIIILKVTAEEFIVVVNAVNREKDLTWMQKQSLGFDAKIEDISDNTALISVQGPMSAEVMRRISDLNLDGLQRFNHTKAKLLSYEALISRTGYTGEDGFEIFLPDCSVDAPERALQVWGRLIEEGAKPCGLGARDTLRLEAGMCLYAQDIDESTTPLEAALSWLIKVDKRGYIGYESLATQMQKGIRRLRVCFILQEGIARRGYNIFSESKEKVGVVTSGTYSPTLRKGVGMGYVEVEYAKPETLLLIDVRGKLCCAVVKKPPLYDTTKYGWSRQHQPV
ncbi:MAG: glycine cleavage system aminomethyltransferase GcvT [Nitrososphaerales archaeon]